MFKKKFFFKKLNIFLFNIFFLKIDLQWMVLNCDPTVPERESCEEIPVSTYSKKKSTSKQN